MYRLKRTLENHPERVEFIRTLWVCVGGDLLVYPTAKDITYPTAYHDFIDINIAIARWDILPLVELVGDMSHVLTRLTIVARKYQPGLRVFFQRTVFPKLEELEAPVDMLTAPDLPSNRIFGNLSLYPKLRKLRVSYDEEKYGAVDVFERQDFTALAHLTHLYLSYYSHTEEEFRSIVCKIRIPPQVRVVVLEANAATQLPTSRWVLATHWFNPKVIVVAKPSALRDLHWSPTAEQHAKQLCLTLDPKTIRETSIWALAEEKSLRRWELFVERYTEDERKMLLSSPSLLVDRSKARNL
ncbi:hypothetical protein VNI00_018861 [Paramarasmius palmivorus]|uniref:Uncharacterized protein n=1 Tax=Paramarasmius palmivorus TaxID=297713 RepID=A0AAW0AVS7_9AGAR